MTFRCSSYKIHQSQPTLVLVQAMQNILESFYFQQTSTVCITQCSNLNRKNRTGPNPYEFVGQLARIKSEKLPITYLIEDDEKLNGEKHRRFFSIIVVDDYDSFRHV